MVPLVVGIEDEHDAGLAIGGGIGLAASFASALIFKKRTDKHMDDFDDSIKEAIRTYNENLLKKCEPIAVKQ